MASVKFVLKDPKSENETLIFCLIRFNNQRLKYSTGFKVDPVYWDKENQGVITDNNHEQLQSLKIKLSKVTRDKNRAINTQLSRYRDKVESISNHFAYLKKNLTLSSLRLELDNEFKVTVEEPEKEIRLNEFIDKFISEMESGKRQTPSGENYKKGTIKTYKHFKSVFIDYQETNRKVLNFDDITIDFYDSFSKYCNDLNYTKNTLGRYIKHLKTVMRSSLEMKLHDNRDFLRKAFRTYKEPADSIYLNETELTRMFKLDLSDKPHLEVARDVFLVGCYTALRFSDFSRITKKHFKKNKEGNGIIEIITQKTNEKVIVPIRWEVEQILKKYDYSLPKTYEQKINKRIKEIGKLAGINEKVTQIKIRGGKRIELTNYKYELIQTHTARRSAATNMYLAGIPSIDIMKITGHRTESSFLAYIKVTKEETADMLANHAYFRKPKMNIA